MRRLALKVARDWLGIKSGRMARRQRLMENYAVDVVLDVGANVGQFGSELRRQGYRGRIISFEPLADAFSALELKATNDAEWDAYDYALGARASVESLHVAGNSYSSSLKPMLETHLALAPESLYVSDQEVDVRPLDSVFSTLVGGGRSVYLKIDTQGFEHEVLSGATMSLPRIDTIQLEMSLRGLYEGEVGFTQLHSKLEDLGYCLVGVEQGMLNGVGEMIQLDGIYRRDELLT